MTPGARLAATIELLDEIVSRGMEERGRPADLVANAYFRTRRFIGGGDRRAISERVWGILRRYGQLAWWLDKARHPGRDARAIVSAELMLVDGLTLDQLAALFDGGRYRPSMLEESEVRALRQMEGHSLPHPEQPDWVRLNIQEWVVPHLKEAYGEAWGREIAALEKPPPVDLRVNRLKASVADARAALEREGIETEPMRYAPDGLRLKRRLSVVAGDAFQNGLVEVQDEGSQIVAALVDAGPGMQVADYCAGAGGKTLAIAAGMNNKGRVVAMDVLETRLDRSAQRLRRAGAHNVERRTLGTKEGDAANRKWLKRQKEAFDRVLVDAPCTGTGTWRRNPDARWTLQPRDLEELVPKQAAILDAAARLVKPDGGLVYATCSVLPAENERQVEAFLGRHPEFELVPVGQLWPDAVGTEPPAEIPETPYLRLSPLRHGTDGFFAAALRRRPTAEAALTPASPTPPPPSSGEVSSSHDDGGVKNLAEASDPSVREDADTSPEDRGGEAMLRPPLSSATEGVENLTEPSAPSVGEDGGGGKSGA